MRFVLLTLTMFVGMAAADAQPAKGKPTPQRIAGMKEAIADIEKGKLTQRYAYPFGPPVFVVQWFDLAKKEYGIDMEFVRDGTPEDDGYNDVMLLEIEHRFGRGVMTKIAERAEAEHLKNKKK